MENTSKIMDRIKKLLALSTSSNPNEAACAAAKAAQLMAQYELEEADLRVESGEANPDPIGTTDWDGIDSSRTSAWRGAIISGLMKAFNCHGWYHVSRIIKNGKSVKRMNFKAVGRRVNVQTANYMFLYLENELKNLAEKAWADLPSSVVVHGKHWKNSFLLGAAYEIHRRLLEQVAKEKAEQVESKALVLVRNDRKEVTAYFNQIKPRLTSISSKSSYNRDAHAQGTEAGSRVNLAGSGGAISAAPRQLTA
jgi:hypothetical protein